MDETSDYNFNKYMEKLQEKIILSLMLPESYLNDIKERSYYRLYNDKTILINKSYLNIFKEN